MKEKALLFCRIKKHITCGSPSATFFCGYGFRYRPEFLCRKCPYKTKGFFELGLSEGLKKGLSHYLGEKNAN